MFSHMYVYVYIYIHSVYIYITSQSSPLFSILQGSHAALLAANVPLFNQVGGRDSGQLEAGVVIEVEWQHLKVRPCFPSSKVHMLLCWQQTFHQLHSVQASWLKRCLHIVKGSRSAWKRKLNLKTSGNKAAMLMTR